MCVTFAIEYLVKMRKSGDLTNRVTVHTRICQLLSVGYMLSACSLGPNTFIIE